VHHLDPHGHPHITHHRYHLTSSAPGLLLLGIQAVNGSTDPGAPIPINSSAMDIDTELFKGKLLVQIRGVPSTEPAFAGLRRNCQVVIQVRRGASRGGGRCRTGERRKRDQNRKFYNMRGGTKVAQHADTSSQPRAAADCRHHQQPGTTRQHVGGICSAAAKTVIYPMCS
jgi:hypothetical protein